MQNIWLDMGLKERRLIMTDEKLRLTMRAASHAMDFPERKRSMFDPVVSMWFVLGLSIGLVIGLIF